MSIKFSTHKRSLLAIAAGVGLVPSASAVQTVPPLGFWTNGHGDIGVVFEDGEFAFELILAEDPGDVVTVGGQMIAMPVVFSADDVGIGLTNPITVPNTFTQAEFDLLGASAGETLLLVPSPNTGVISPEIGLATEELEGLGLGQVTFTLESVTGPGAFSVFGIDGDDGSIDFIFASADGVGDTFTLPPGSESDLNFGFSEFGDYEVTLSAQTELLATGEILTTEQTFIFSSNIVPEPSSLLLLGLGSLFGLRRRR